MSFRSFVALFFIVVSFPVAADSNPPQAAIASAHPLATAAGREILEAGGNAFDAAVAVSAALAVVEPFSSGLGGGGFFLLHRARDGRDVMIDARERAPGAARADMFLDDTGRLIPRASLDGPLAAAIPGLPAGLVHLAKRYGALPLSRTLAPAVRLAREGFAVTPRYRRMAELRRERLLQWGGASVFLDGENVPAVGHVVRQPDLARTFDLLSKKGDAGFYRGDTAKRLVESVRARGGIWSVSDLESYTVIEREPLRGNYRGVRIITAALPSSGGVLLLEALGILEQVNLEPLSPPDRAHMLIEVMRRAYRDRALHLGDPDFIERGIAARLLDPRRLIELSRSIDKDRATPSTSLSQPDGPAFGDGKDTTHFSIIDTAGNRVAATLSINTPFGSAFIASGTGVVLNNEMDDFAAAPDSPNNYGLVGRKANFIAPGKRPLSSMTPTFIETPDRVVLLGTPGGSRIVSMVLLATLETMRQATSAKDWVAAPRFHHQYLPDRVDYEPNAFSVDVVEALKSKGHSLRVIADGYGNMQIVAWDRAKQRVDAASDPRGEGEAAVFTVQEKRKAAVGATLR